jgi:lysozyme family protein
MEFAILGAAKKTATTTVSKATAKRLQAALATLGKVVGSAKLKAIKADGVLGPKTVEAVNWAFTNHIGSGQAPAEYRTGNLTLSNVKSMADTLSTLIEREIARRGAKTASPATVTKGQAIQAVQKAPPVQPASKADIKRLQSAIVALGKVVGSAQLKAVKVDGALGPKTVAAVNWAFTHHIGSGQAPAGVRTGNLTLDYVKGNATTLANLIETEVKRRGAKATTTAGKTAAVTPAKKADKATVKGLQTALVALGRTVGSAQLKAIKVDGALGAKTVAAVNWAFTHHIGSGQAPAQYRTGNLTLNDVSGNAETLTNLINTETKRRGGSTVVAVAKTTKKAATVKPASQSVLVKTDSGKTVKATKVSTASGDTYKVEDLETGETTYTDDPTKAAGTTAKSPAAATAEVSEEEPSMPTSMIPSGGGGSFFSEYKWPIIGVGAAMVLGIGALVVLRRPAGGASAGNRAPAPRRTAGRRAA